MSKNCLIFLCALTFCACAFAGDNFWCEGQTVAIEKCPTNEAIKNITVELAKGTDGKIVPTSILFGVKVKTGAYELDLNVDKWLAWSRGEAKKDSLVWFTVPQGVWETFGKDGKLTLTIKDTKGSLTEPPIAVAVMSDCADWPGEKDCRSYFMRGVDLMGSGDYDEAIKYFNECMETYEADVWRFAHYFIRKCKLQKELEKMAQDEKLQTSTNYHNALLFALHSRLQPEAMVIRPKIPQTPPLKEEPSNSSINMPSRGDHVIDFREFKEIALSNLTAVVGQEVSCASNAVFFTVADYKKPKGSRYVRRYFKESSALDNYLNLEREKAAALRYEKGEEVRDLLFVKLEDVFPYLLLRPEFKQHVLGVLTVKDVPDSGKDQRLLVFDLPGALLGETYPDEGEDILSFEAK